MDSKNTAIKLTKENNSPSMRRAIVRIFNASMATTHMSGVRADEHDAPEIRQYLIDNFKHRLTSNDYEFVKKKDGVLEYRHTGNRKWSLKVLISKNEIAFTCSPKDMFMFTLLYEALQTASQLCDHNKLAIYHCDGRGWINTEALVK